MVRIKQFNIVTDKPILANNPKRMPTKKSKKKKKKKQKREEWESEEEQTSHVDEAFTSKAEGEKDWKPSSDVDIQTTSNKPKRKRRKTKKMGFPQKNDLVGIDFDGERFEAIVLDAGETLIDVKYPVDGSCEYVNREHILSRNMELLKRPAIGSKIKKKFQEKVYNGVITKIFESEENVTLYRVKYKDDDEEDLEIEELITMMV